MFPLVILNWNFYKPTLLVVTGHFSLWNTYADRIFFSEDLRLVGGGGTLKMPFWNIFPMLTSTDLQVEGQGITLKFLNHMVSMSLACLICKTSWTVLYQILIYHHCLNSYLFSCVWMFGCMYTCISHTYVVSMEARREICNWSYYSELQCGFSTESPSPLSFFWSYLLLNTSVVISSLEQHMVV